MVAIVTGNGLGLERSSAWVLGSRGQLGGATLGRDSEDLYVNAATGNLIVHGADEILLGRFVGAQVGHSYNSLGAMTDDNGDNWRPGVSRTVVGTNGNATITRTDWDGSEEVFNWNASLGYYTFKDGEGAEDTLSFAGNVWTWTDGDTQMVELYDHLNGGRLTNVNSPIGFGLTYTYASGKLDRVTTIDGDYVAFSWSGNNLTQLATVTNGGTATTTRVRYGYDGSNRLTSVTTDLSPGDNAVGDGNVYTLSYTYDGSSKRIASIAQQDGSLIQFSYVLVGSDYRVASYTQTVAAGVMRTTSFDYSVAGRTTVTDPAGQKAILFYDSNKRLTQISYPPENANTTPRVVQFAYDSNGNVASATLGPGNVITYGYDSRDNLILERDSAGNTISRTYGARNELLTETRYLVPDPDGAGGGAASAPVTTRYAYDAWVRMTFSVSAEGRVTEYRYNDSGLHSVTVEYTANSYDVSSLSPGTALSHSTLASWAAGISDKSTTQRTDTNYDYRGNVSTITSYSVVDSAGNGLTSSDYSRTTYVYDHGGRLLSRQTNAGTASEVFVYDGLGRLTQATDFNGAVTRSYFLDSLGQTVLTHANGLSEVSTYDRAGELIAFSQSNAGGNLIDVTGWPGNPGSVPGGQATVPGWMNPVGFTDETQWASTTGPDGLQVVAMRAGQLDASAEGGGNYSHEVTIDPTKAYEFTYYFKIADRDKHNIYFGLSGWSPAYVENVANGVDDSNPYFFAIAAAGQSATYAADTWYKVVAYVLPQGAAAPAAPVGGVYNVATGQKIQDVSNTYRWNPERPNNSVHTRFFNYYGESAQGYSTYFYQPEIRQVSTPTVTGSNSATSLYRYDNLGRLRMTVDPTGRRQYMMYDNVGRKVADIDADGSVTEYRYDGNDNVTSTTRYATKISVGSLVDANGNPTSATFASLRPSANDAEDQWTWQVYDSAQRLVQTIDGTGATTVYTYDGASRVTATKTFANRLSSTILAGLRAEARNPNLWGNPTDGTLWGQSNLSVAATGTTIDGAPAYQFTVVNASQWEAFAAGTFTAYAGDTISYTISIKAVGSTTTDVTGIYSAYPSSWGANADGYATIVSGPGTLSQWVGGLFYISGLSTTEATRITITRKILQDDAVAAYFYVANTDYIGLNLAGKSVIAAAPVYLRSHSAAINLPTADAANDRVSRNFYDADGRVVATMDAAGGLGQVVYDKAGRKIRELGSAKAVTQSLRAAGTLAQLVSDVGTSGSDRRADYVYDARGFLRFTVDASAKPVETVYDGAGRVVRTIDYAGSITAAASYSLAYVQAQLSATGLSTSTSNRITRTVYDADGQAAFTIDAAGTVTAFTYDNVGNVIKQAGYATAYTTAGDQSLATMQSWVASHAADPGNRASRGVYDVHGRVAYTVDAEGYVREHRYDAAGRAAKDIIYADVYTVTDGVTKESLAAQIGGLPSTAVVVTYAYNADGLLSDVTDGVGAVTHFAYNSFGDVTDRTIAYGTGDASTLHYSYDVLGRVSIEFRGYGTTAVATTVYTYDAVGNVIVTTDALSRVWIRTYDAVGRVLTVTAPVDANSANDLITVNEYDAFGDLVKVTDPRGNTTFNYYDALGRLTLQSDAERFITQTSYTAFGQAYQVTRRAARGTGTPTVTAPPTVVTGSGDATTTFAYDKMGRVATLTDAEGFSETYYYDAFGERYAVYNKLSGPTSYGYDRLGRLYYQYDYTPVYRPDGTLQASGNYSSLFNYDAQGHVVLKVEAYNITERRNTYYTYDKAGRVVTVTHDAVQVVGSDLSTVSTVTPTESYTYNLRGDLIQSVDAGGGKTLAWYDVLGRKTDEVSAVGTLSHWTYDGNGNVLTARIYGDAVAIPGTPGGSPPAPVNASNYRETYYLYDRSNRRTTAIVSAIKSGVYVGGAYVTTYSGEIGTGVAYDKNGNVVRETDGIGYASLTWYDALDRKVAQVDREGYLTVWARDANGNVASETRYANKITSSYNESTAVGTLPGLAGTNAADRTTIFTYDRNGRRLTETRQGVAVSTPSGGTISTITQNATITYAYNGLGLVTSKTEASGDVTTYIYDNSGRLITTKGATMVDNTGTTIRLQTDYFYDGLGDVVRTVQHGDVYANAPDRITTSAYGAGGRLAAITDANGFVRNYAYDAAGRVVKESWSRLKSDGTTNVTEAIGYRFDLAGRMVTQAAATWNGSSFVFGDATRIRYDTYGEVTGRGITGGPNDTAVYQETFDYDSGGRVWRSNAGDGVIKIMFYDKGGNATLTLSSTGADLSGQTYDSAMASLTAAGGTNIANAVTTIAVLDRRGQQIQSLEPGRQLTASTWATLTTSRAYNAFGEVTSETDARGNATTFSYGALGRLIQKVSPIVNWTGEDGAVHTTDHPTENYYYDISGRLVGVRDANNNLTTRQLLAGTGYGGADPLVRSETHADGGVATTWYNVFGDARAIVNELGATEYRAYDNMGRVTSVLHRGSLFYDYYAYDGLGQRTRHYNSQLGSGVVERTDYDVQNRVSAQVDYAGGTTSYAYSWVGTLGTTGMGNFGGWQKSTTDPTSHTVYEYNDYFGRLVGKINPSGQLSYGFDLGGRLTWETNSVGQTQTNSWFNTGSLYQVVDAAGSGKNTITSTYGYDEAGNRTYEGHAGTVYSYYFPSGTTAAGLTLQNSTITYDALGRTISITDKDAAGTTRVTIANQYDLASNVRRTNTTYPNLAYPQYGSITEDKWFRYDSMNRMVVADGQLVSGQVVRGAFGQDVTYDAASRRVTQTKDAYLTGYAWQWVWYPEYDPNGPGWHDLAPMEPGTTGDYQQVAVSYAGARQEQYVYRADGELYTVSFAETGYTDNGDGTVSSTGSLAAAVLRAQYDRDAIGRITEYREFDAYGAVTQDRYNIAYDYRNAVTSESLSQKKIESGAVHTYVTNSVNNYTNGLLMSSTGDLWRDGSDSAIPDTSTTYSYAWYDGAVVSSSSYDSDTGTSSNAIWTSSYAYDGLGRLASVDIADGRRRTVSFAYTAEGQVLNRKERSAASANPEDQYLYLNGVQVGYLTSNGNGDPATSDYASVEYRNVNWSNNPVSAPFRWNTTGGVTDGEFGGSGYDYINPAGQGDAPGRYIARNGDTLQSIAAQAWGDASLWYLIASFNGMNGSESLVAGQSLSIPDRVTNIHNNASTFQVYDPNRALGDLSPTAPKPPKKANGCAVVGQILMAIVAVAVTIYTAGALTGALGPVLAGAIGGAAGSVASQGIGIATGLQHGFDFKGVAMGALGGAVGGALGPGGAFGKLGAFGKVGSSVAQGALRGAAGSLLTQGIAVATGLQDKFSWSGIAGAALGGGLSNAVSRGLIPGMKAGSISPTMANGVSNAVGALANAGARSLIDGTDFGDNLLAALPDVIGSTIGNWIVGEVQGSGSKGTVEKADDVSGSTSSDVVVTANQGGHSANPANAPAADILPRAMRDDPEMKALASSVRDSNLAQLRARYGDARERVDDRIKARDNISTSLDGVRATLTNATEARQIERIQRRITSLERDLARANRLLNRDTLRESTAAQEFETAQGHLTALQNYFVGKAVNVRGGTYTIRGPNPTGGYRSRDEAATDAITMAWAVDRATNRHIEYAGYIYEDTPNVFTYDQTTRIGRGAEARTMAMALTTGGEVSAVFSGQNPSRREVGMFHIHPRNSQLDEVANAYFGPGDLDASQRTSHSEGRSLPHYLGGSDGAIRVLSDPLALPPAPVYNAAHTSTHTSPPLSSYREVKPAGYFRVN